MPQIFVGALLHQLGKPGLIVHRAVQRRGHHHQRAAVIGAAQQTAVYRCLAQARLHILGGIFITGQYQRNDERCAIRMGRVGPAQPGIAGVDLLVDGLQLGGQAVHARHRPWSAA